MLAVMVSAGFVHLLGQAIKELNPHDRFPVAPFLCGLGFLVTLVADHVAEVLSHRNGWEAPEGHCMSPTLDGEMTRLQHVLAPEPLTPGRHGEAHVCATLWSDQLPVWLLASQPVFEHPSYKVAGAAVTTTGRSLPSPLCHAHAMTPM